MKMSRTGYRIGRSGDVKIRDYMIARRIIQKRRGSIVVKQQAERKAGKHHGRERPDRVAGNLSRMSGREAAPRAAKAE